ncbi:unnamed protein product [Lactuca saligna]|uniref:Uncharacterized protein n=1 Tax=Lactuca saligna TaxID=75948 RepID=A0AA35UTN4_LACSI|nr:unnamed protein product [Lactuca saligna]
MKNQSKKTNWKRESEIISEPLESECSRLPQPEDARVLRIDEVEECDDDINEWGINEGIRPPLLAPPPGISMSRVVVDNLSSSWELIWGFATKDDEDSTSLGAIQIVGDSNEDDKIDVHE